MKIAITGTPGSGKTTLAKMLGKEYKLNIINEKDFAIQNGIGKFNDENELEIPLLEFEKKANEFLLKNDGILLEGHVLCEVKLKVDYIILISINPEELEARLEQRNYPPLKIMDNVFCEGIDYCKKNVVRNYPKEKIIQISSKTTQKLTFMDAVREINLKKPKTTKLLNF